MQTNLLYNPVSMDRVEQTHRLLKDIIVDTPTEYNAYYSEQYGSSIYFKREDQQVVRSYKIRGAYNKIRSIECTPSCTIVCASAGNHAQGVALACQKLAIKGVICMPSTTPFQKIEQVRLFGKEWIDIKIHGDTFDECMAFAQQVCIEQNGVFVHPFDDQKTIEGQATIGLEIVQSMQKPIDYLYIPIGGGGLAAGLCSVFKVISPQTKLIGVEPKGAASMTASIANNRVVTLSDIEVFVDGASVKEVGQLTFPICREHLDDVVVVDEGLICKTVLDLYNRCAIVAEPAGAMSIAALSLHKDQIQGKTVVCILSGGNNDLSRMEEIRERALMYEQKKHYFLVNFPQRSGALREFLNQVLGPNDDIIHFQYIKKYAKEKGHALVGVELADPADLNALMASMIKHRFLKSYLNEEQALYELLI